MQHVKTFDFVGLILIMGAVVCLLVGFNESENSWSSPATIALITVAGVVFAIGRLRPEGPFYPSRTN